jgi:hypothetical protein
LRLSKAMTHAMLRPGRSRPRGQVVWLTQLEPTLLHPVWVIGHNHPGLCPTTGPRDREAGAGALAAATEEHGCQGPSPREGAAPQPGEGRDHRREDPTGEGPHEAREDRGGQAVRARQVRAAVCSHALSVFLQHTLPPTAHMLMAAPTSLSPVAGSRQGSARRRRPWPSTRGGGTGRR